MKIVNLIKNYKIKNNIVNVYNGLNLDIADKGFVFIVGKSGCGKSTLLNIISGFDKCESGQIIYKEKNILKMSDRKLDYYRKKDIGFIVQDYNLLENLTVLDNIKINVDLQNLKIEKSRIYNLLDKLGILELKDRKINELSGGQQQRVAIARAIVKSPSLLLCDEPTGNLDTETANDIFNLLSKLSKEKLVLVVTHDINSALNYGDRIIFIDNGKVEEDRIINNIIYDNKSDNVKLKCKTKLFNDFEMSRKIIKYKKSIWILTLLILIISISSLGVSILFSNFDIPKSHANAMIKNNENTIKIEKNLPTTDNEYLSQNEVKDIINSDDLKKIEFMMKEKAIINHKLYSDSIPINFDFDRNENKKTLYYNTIINNLNFIKINTTDDLDNMKLELIGNFPKNNNEIIISQYLADYIIFHGIKYKNNNKIYQFKPNNYDELLSNKNDIYINNYHVLIAGIVKNKQKFDLLKKTASSHVNNEKEINDELELFSENYPTLTSVYILDDFLNNISFIRNNKLDNDLFLYGIKQENEISFISSDLIGLDSTITILNNNGMSKIDNLQNNEIIINEEMLNNLTNGEYTKQLNVYLNNKKIEQEEAINDYEKLIDIISVENNKENNESFVDGDITDIINETEKVTPQAPIIKTDKEIEQEFTNFFLNENKIINKKILISFVDQYGFGLNKDMSLIIKGFESDNSNVYISINNISKYTHNNIEISGLIFNENKYDKIKTIFLNFPINNSQFTSKTVYSNSIINIIHNLNNISKFSSILLLVSTILSLIIIALFLTSIISFNQKNIGILRSLGVSKKSIFKMILYKAFFINIISIFISGIIIYLIYYYGNLYFTKNMFYSIEPLIFNITIILKLFIFSLIIMLISTILNVIKINKLNPIDIIKKL